MKDAEIGAFQKKISEMTLGEGTVHFETGGVTANHRRY